MFNVSPRTWLYSNWFYAGLVVCIFLLAIAPVLWRFFPLSLLIVYLQLPLYMFHQVEEHVHDRFRLFINLHVGGGVDALTPDAVLVINIGSVWLFDLCALYLSCFVRPGLGLLAMYMAIVNALTHLVGATLIRSYNPGVITGVVLLLPGGLLGCRILNRAGATVADHIWCLCGVIFLHLVMIVYLRFRITELRRLHV